MKSLKFIVVENKATGVIHKHTYQKFQEVRSFCEEKFPNEYIKYMSMATIASLLEKHNCEFEIVQGHDFDPKQCAC